MDITRFRERWRNTTRTSLATCTRALRRLTIENQNGDAKGEAKGDGKVELRDTLVIETTDGRKDDYEIVGLVEDDEHNSFAVAYSEAADQFIVTDDNGKLLEDDALAQEILDDFLILAEESAPEEN
jgi:hypothetical protein